MYKFGNFLKRNESKTSPKSSSYSRTQFRQYKMVLEFLIYKKRKIFKVNLKHFRGEKRESQNKRTIKVSYTKLMKIYMTKIVEKDQRESRVQ